MGQDRQGSWTAQTNMKGASWQWAERRKKGKPDGMGRVGTVRVREGAGEGEREGAMDGGLKRHKAGGRARCLDWDVLCSPGLLWLRGCDESSRCCLCCLCCRLLLLPVPARQSALACRRLA